MTQSTFSALYLFSMLRHRHLRRRLVERIARRYTTHRRAASIARRIP